MSREDPQFKLRMPIHLRDKAEQSARASGRSLNAELVTRIEASFLGEKSLSTLMPAARAKELAMMARSRLPEEVRFRAIDAINRAITLGHSDAVVDLSDLHLDFGISDEELDSLFKETMEELKLAGYKVKWDDITSLWIEF